jgi:hypothetical protein
LSPESPVIPGHSMQTLIPDGSLCVVRHGVAGLRQGRLMLVESLDAIADNKYAVKRCQSTKAAQRRAGGTSAFARSRSIPNTCPGTSTRTKKNTASSRSSCVLD